MVLTEISMKGVFMKHILSFDIAKGKSVYCFIDELKNIIIKPLQLNIIKTILINYGI